MSGAQDRPIIVYGTGSTARVTGHARRAARAINDNRSILSAAHEMPLATACG